MIFQALKERTLVEIFRDIIPRSKPAPYEKTSNSLPATYPYGTARFTTTTIAIANTLEWDRTHVVCNIISSIKIIVRCSLEP